MRKKLISIISIIVILIGLVPISSKAVVPIDTAYIYANKKTNGLLMWKGLRIHTHLAVYKKDGKEYPAYCMDRELPGVEIGRTQTVDVKQLVNNVMVWRAIINGYPYKSISELGCNTEEEVYLATKQAVYCMLTNRDVNEYSAIGESGERTLNALKTIVNNARNSNQTKVSSELTVNEQEKLWKIDDLDGKYISKTFSVTANTSMSKYTVNVKNLKIEGYKLVDQNNKEKTEFTNSEKFKILIPIQEVKQDGNFSIEVSAQVATKPVFYGESRDSGLQSYALTGYTYEEGTGSKKVYYTKNETKIIITKTDDKTGKKLEGVEFELLDKDQNKIYTEITTNKDGMAIIDNLLPGIYYIRETKTLEGYQLYSKLIKVELELNEETTVNVINSEKEPEIYKEEKKTELAVKEKKSNIKVKETGPKLPKTGM
ncbi:MAG: SpaA isopeptide-forming pilin-related protein [Clostridia bacterium]|nr:SpaA isopeptide-forming pilin-related protein [Clostridia bacterium]